MLRSGSLVGPSLALRQVQKRADAIHVLGSGWRVGAYFADLVADKKSPHLMISSTIVRAHQ